MGGIGNQMFQYAAARAVAERTDQEIKLDISAYKQNNLRHYSLSHFNIRENFAELKDFFWLKLYKEPHFEFDPQTLNIGKDVYMQGYFQSEKYFKDIEGLIRKDFTFRGDVRRKIQDANSVNVHIRRGDYVSNPKTNVHHGICPMGYYRKAISLIANRIKDPHFFVFSDDINWAKDNFHFEYPITFVAGNEDWEDMQLMTHCKHHIIANSAFSWWGAWLSPFPEKTIIAPKKWFNKANLGTKDLIPNGWIKT